MIEFSIFSRYINVDESKHALISSDHILTYGGLNTAVNKVCNSLASLGVSSGQKAALLGGHNSDFIIMLLALWRLGAIPIPLNNRLNNDELINILNISSPGFLFTDKTAGRELPSACRQHSFPLIGIEETETEWDLHSDHTGIVIFTSGTTGQPKGVVLSGQNIISSAAAANNILQPAPDDKWLASLPLFHIGGIMIITRALLAGLTVIIPDSFDPVTLGYCFSKYQPAFVSLVPTVLRRLIEQNINPGKIKWVLLGGGPVDDSLARQAVSAGWNVLKVYGSSETCSMFTGLHINKDINKISSAGLPFPGNKLRIVNDRGTEVEPGVIGEIAVSGPSVFQGYLNNSEETAGKLKDGIYYTGDLGYLDKDGFLFIEARRTDLIISGGENISPAEIENALLKIKGIDQACVIGIPDEEWGQTPAAVLKLSQPLSAEQILSELRKLLSSYKLPGKIFFTNELPLNELGKINRHKLKELILQQEGK